MIAVVNVSNVTGPQTFYDFFRKLGCRSLAINIEEREGLHRTGQVVEEKPVRHFWDGLFRAWLEKPDLRIREFDQVIGWLRSASNPDLPSVSRQSDLWPTISTSGDVVVVSPELIAAEPDERKRFIVGNVLSEPLTEIVGKALDTWYVKEFLEGVSLCHQQCPYFSYCGGGQGSNKYFETGSFKTTETHYCRNARQAPVDAILAQFENNT